MKKSNNKKGFTLVELVIVVAVIAILSAILIPTIGTVIKDAKDAAFQSDLQSYVTSEITTNKVISEQYVLKVKDDNTVEAYYKIDKNGNFKKVENPTDVTGVTNDKITPDEQIGSTGYMWSAHGSNGLYVLTTYTSGADSNPTV